MIIFNFVLVNELQLFMGKEEEEEDGGNASKVDEGGKTVSGVLWWFISVAAEFIFYISLKKVRPSKLYKPA